MDNIESTISGSELFYGIPENKVSEMFSCLNGSVKCYPAGKTVWRAGERIAQVGIVIEGKVYMENSDFWGNKSIVTEYVKGNSFGEAYALAKNESTVFDVVAKENTRIAFFDITKLTTTCENRCDGHRQLIENLLSTVATKARDLSLKMNHICKRTTREKLLSYLSGESQRQHSPTIHIPFNRQELADYLSVERCSMSKELHKMKNDGLVDFVGNSFTLKTN